MMHNRRAMVTRKKAVKPRVPRTRGGGTLTESGYWSFVRAGLRAKSVTWPPRFQILNNNRRTAKGKRYRYEYQCFSCTNWFKASDIEVDHIIPVGSLRCKEDLPEYVERLFCEIDNLQLLCKECHLDKTHNRGEP